MFGCWGGRWLVSKQANLYDSSSVDVLEAIMVEEDQGME